MTPLRFYRRPTSRGLAKTTKCSTSQVLEKCRASMAQLEAKATAIMSSIVVPRAYMQDFDCLVVLRAADADARLRAFLLLAEDARRGSTPSFSGFTRIMSDAGSDDRPLLTKPCLTVPAATSGRLAEIIRQDLARRSVGKEWENRLAARDRAEGQVQGVAPYLSAS
jgi:hypothetical protein